MKFSGRAFLKSIASRISLINIAASKKQRVLIVFDASVEGSLLILSLVQILMRYGILEHETYNTSQSTEQPNLSDYSCIVTIFGVSSFFSSPNRIDELQAFVKSGGGMVALIPEINGETSTLFGASHTADDSGKDLEPFIFRRDFFPGLKGIQLVDRTVEQCTPAQLEQKPNVECLVSFVSGSPLVWKKTLGKGAVIVWNTNLFMRHDVRGILLQTILSAQPVSVQAIANAGMFVIDDFPAGFSDNHSPLLDEEFGLSFLEFLDQAWLPDILNLASTYGVQLSFAIPFSYNAKIEAPFDFTEWEGAKVATPNGDLPYAIHFVNRLKNKGELGLHGYNHLPLVTEEWKTPDAMINSLQEAMTRWEADGLGPPPTFYVPPMNEYDSLGAKALTDAIPSIRVICGAQGANPERGADQQFRPDPWNPLLFCMPRVSCGYILEDETMLQTVSMVAGLGVWTHNIHPDDIIDTESTPGAPYLPRNAEKRWWRSKERGSMRDELQKILSFVKDQYPWLRYMTVTPASDTVKKHLANRVDVIRGNNLITLRSETPTDIRLRINHSSKRTPARYSGVEMLHHHKGPDYDLFTLRLIQSTGSIKLKPAT